jgi:hypothetical protein
LHYPDLRGTPHEDCVALTSFTPELTAFGGREA